MGISTKTEIRARYIEKRNQLAPAVREQESAQIRECILQHPAWKEAGTLLLYVSCGSEVATHRLITEALEQKKRVIVPLISSDKNETLVSELYRFSELFPGPFKKVLEPGPAFRKLVDPSEVELALVPGVVFDKRGGRIGFGGGYFDRLLPKMPQAPRWGLAFSIQIYPAPLPKEAHDMRMHVLITEQGLMETRKP
ncbi:MAG: 5-formyltetrahydrofolate cyclo-ligase [Elusimicrobiota bacterium]|jgi:5-formyltetrahydrofolate cyclo-ligase